MYIGITNIYIHVYYAARYYICSTTSIICTYWDRLPGLMGDPDNKYLPTDSIQYPEPQSMDAGQD